MKMGITGWRGFIGSHLKDKIENPILFQGDLRNLEDVKLFTKDCDRIYHVAGKNREGEGDILANNLVATGNLILASKLQDANPEIIFLSSKQAIWNPNSEYGLTKMIEEGIVRKARRWCIFRVPNVFGAGGKPFYNSVIATFTYQLAHKQAVTINNPDETREFIFVEDLVNRLLSPHFFRHMNIKGEKMSVGKIYEFLTTRLGDHPKLKECLEYYQEVDNVSP